MHSPFMKIFSHLSAHFGPQGWWPGEGPLEISVGAILTQNTNWENAHRSIVNLKIQNLLHPSIIRDMEHSSLAQAIHSSGYHNQKARKLKHFMCWLSHYGDDWNSIQRRSLSELRQELLSIWGIGEETADSILLYALDKPIFVIDAYTRRILSRHQFCSSKESYDSLQQLLMNHLPQDTALYNEYHALLVRLGKQYCQKKPQCRKCPLVKFSPEIQGAL